MVSSNYTCAKWTHGLQDVKLLFTLPINQTGMCTTFKRSDETYSPYPKIPIISRPIIHLHMYMNDF